ncbi:long-chain fatty acid-CoA ligase [Chytriomyces hyalinus]|nr:long-chain fatty acid-CoA ligase [Chytriomyces hyalinus]
MTLLAQALPNTEGPNSTAIYRRANAVDALTFQPSPDIFTIHDLFVQRGFTRPTLPIFGARKVLNTVVEEKEVAKKLPSGETVTEIKKWTFFELSAFEWMTWSEVQILTAAYASGYRALGMNSGDKLAIYADTSRDWMLNAIASFQQSFAITTAYATLGEEGLTHSLNECDITTVFTNAELIPMLDKVANKVKTLKNIVYNGVAEAQVLASIKKSHPRLTIITLDELRALGEKNLLKPVAPAASDLAFIMYTSGSTGTPKGVCLTHANIIAGLSGNNTNFEKAVHPEGKDEFYLAFLPLSHILEFAVEMYMVYKGVAIGYGNPKTLIDSSVRNCKGDLRELRPTLFTAVPAVWDAIRKAVEAKLKAGSSIANALFWGAFNIKASLMSAGLDVLAAPLDALVFAAVKEQVGGRLKMAMSAGAPITRSTQQFLNVTTARMINAYGMTETTAGICLQERAQSCMLGCVGAPVTNMEVKLVDVPEAGYKASNLPKPQGELWCRGPGVMVGYYKRPDLTREAITEDGWMQTGDIAELNPDGSLTIIDRTKNLVKLSNGEYIALEKMESNYKVSKCVQSLCVYANPEKSFAVGIVQPVEKAILQLAQELALYPGIDVNKVDYQELCGRKEIRAAVLKDLQAIAKSVSFKQAEILGQIFLAHEEWTPQNGMLTAAMKLQRKLILEKYKKEVADMYAQ